MKILYIITQADGGGAQKYVLAHAKHFGGEIAAGEGQELFSLAERQGIKTHHLKHLKRSIHPWHDFLVVFEIMVLIKKLNPDIVHLNSSKAGVVGSIAGKLAGKKVIFTAHGFQFLEYNNPLVRGFYIFLEKFASVFRDFIIAVSDNDRLNALKYHLVNPLKIQTIHNGISTINFLSQPEARKILGLTDDKIILGTIANFYPTKGLDIFIRSINLLPAEITAKIVVIIIGDGPERKKLSALINSYDLNNTVQLLGAKTDAARLLKALDIFILSSRKEGFSFVLLEALQAGLPVIASDVGGNQEALGAAGVIIPNLNPKTLSQAILELINNPQLREGYSKKAIQRSALFYEEKMLAETAKVYQK